MRSQTSLLTIALLLSACARGLAAPTQSTFVASPTVALLPTDAPFPFQTGIFSDTYGPQVKTFWVVNHWQGIVNGEQAKVYAGARADDTLLTPATSKGLIYVVIQSQDDTSEAAAEYEAPGDTGILTVIAEGGYRLTLSAQNGSTLYFDIPTRMFVDSLSVTASAPTVTPLPLETPTVGSLPTGYPQQTATPVIESTGSP